jgi:hypothetical protein
MKTANLLTSSCRYCRYYQSQGRRGGFCQQLSVPVQAHWKACNLAASPFNSLWEDLEKIVDLENVLSLAHLPAEVPQFNSCSQSAYAKEKVGQLL